MKKIEIKTYNNGYSLDVEGLNESGFFYHNERALFQGFVLHVGLKMGQFFNTDEMSGLIEAAIKWSDNEKCVKEIERLTAMVEKMTTTIRSKENENVRFRNKLASTLDLVKSAAKTKSRDESVKLLQNAMRVVGNIKAPTEKELKAAEEEVKEDEE